MSLEFLILILISILKLGSTDILFSEGYYQYSTLPGLTNKSDPNYPFTTNTDRYADGITSSSAFTSTSPRFPYYLGASANYSQRYLHYLRYSENAAAQGVALYGAGDMEIEDARVKLINRKNYLDLPRPNKTFTVYAAIRWNPSDFAIQTGETYNITVKENSFWYDGGIRVDANGYSSHFDSISNCYVGLGRCRPHLKKKRRVKTGNWMSLSCAIGQFVRPLTEIEAGKESTYRWMPLEEAELANTVFEVGKSTQFYSTHSGQLICFANDANTLYWNNHGQIEVTVTRISWPPSNVTEYQEFLLPSCDSAQVVYVNHGINTGSGKVKCNPNGGGSGWKLSDILNVQGNYGPGAPPSIFSALTPALRAETLG